MSGISKLSWSVLLLLLLLPVTSTVSFAYTEISAQYSRQEQVYGDERQNQLTTDTVYGSIALYFLRNTALELNYTDEKQEDQVSSAEVMLRGVAVTLRSLKHVRTAIYGLGIKQSLAGRRSTFRPAVSIGYARKTVHDSTTFTMYDVTGNTSSTATEVSPVVRQNSVFAALSLGVRLGRRISWTSSVQTVFKSSRIDRVSDNIKYMTGLSLIL